MTVNESQVAPDSIEVCRQLIKRLKVRVTNTSFQEIENHPTFPSIQSISETFLDWNIDNKVVRISVDQLAEIPYPAIAHLPAGKGRFILLGEVSSSQLEIFDVGKGWITMGISEFSKVWNGVVLLVSKTDASGEDDYNEKRKVQIVRQVTSSISIILFAISVLFAMKISSFQISALLSVKILGMTICLLLLQKQFGVSNKFTKKVCNLGTITNCDNVLGSSGAKLFGIFSMSEIGVMYFSVGIIAVLLSAYSHVALKAFLLTGTLICLPYTFFSIGYQFRLKSWCPLCVLVMSIFWLELVVLAWNLTELGMSNSGLLVSFFSIVFPVIFWFSIRDRFKESHRIPNMKRRLDLFLRNDSVFQQLLSRQLPIDMPLSENELMVGSPNASLLITLVTNPTCGPCTQAYATLERLRRIFGENMRINYRFLIPLYDQQSISVKVAKHITTIALQQSNEHGVKAIFSWIISGKRNVKAWMAKNPILYINDGQLVESILQKQIDWCLANNITTTPTILINGKVLPEAFSSNELKNQLRSVIQGSNTLSN